MDKSAEDVPFRDRARFQLLLHFWPIVSSIFVPETEDREGKREFWGYAFAIPDVSSLDSFCTVWNEAMRSRGIGPTAYLPREAVVALCREAGLAALARLRSRLSAIQASDVAEVVLAFDVIHAEKPGNAVKITEVGRIEPRAQMIDEYERLRSALWDHAFRRQRIENLLEGTPWYGGFDRLLRTLPYERILGRQFAHDAAIEFEHVLSEKGDRGMAEPKDLEEIVLAVATSYVARRVSSKNGLTWADAKGDPAKEREYAETKEKAAKGAFLAIRSRTGADFVDYFAGTLCSVPQRLSNDDFSTLSRALRERPDEVRTLTMLALSARS